MAGVKDGTAQTRTSEEGNMCPCLSVNVLEVHAAASVTIQFSGQSQGGIGWEEGASPLQDIKMIPGFTSAFIG